MTAPQPRPHPTVPGWVDGGPNPAVAGNPPAPPQPAPAHPLAGGPDWVKRARQNFREGGVFWRPAQWNNQPHIFLGITDLGETAGYKEEMALTVEVETLIAFNQHGWCLYVNQRVRQKALYWRLKDNAPNTYGYIQLGEKGNSPQRPWVLVKPDESLEHYIDVWREENAVYDPVTGKITVIGVPTLEPPPAPDDSEEAF